jgi:aspartyl-tRNA(Asn)/glutamyl-tRNA(Gln) amidotransferase subunit A
LAAGDITARALVEQALERIDDPAGEGPRAFMHVSRESARKQADEIDRRRAAGQRVAPFAGVPAAIKDLFDSAGEVTRAGSRVLNDRPPAAADAPAVARLRAAGFIIIGRNTMTEFAYSGLGLNPHYGTPLSPFDRDVRRIAGGSTSGGAVAVADGMAAASLGSDTGGSCRIPAAFTGVVGFKPTAHRVPREGVVPLSPTLDSVGPLARSVACCAALDAILRGTEPQRPAAIDIRELRLLAPTTLLLDEMQPEVASAFERAIQRLREAGASVVEAPLPDLARIPQVNANGGIAAAEAYAWHRELLERAGDQYDPRVAVRILQGAALTPQDVRAVLEARRQLIDSIGAQTRSFDAIVAPTTPIIPPPLSAFESDAEYVRLNALVLRNPSLANFLDGCSISLPIHEPGAPPVGLMLIGEHDADQRLLAVAAQLEKALEA